MGSVESTTNDLPAVDIPPLPSTGNNEDGDKPSLMITPSCVDEKEPPVLAPESVLSVPSKPEPNPDDELLPSSSCTSYGSSTQELSSLSSAHSSSNNHPPKEEIKVGWSPIHIAASTGNLTLLKSLCESGVDKDKGKSDGLTPLHIAAVNGNLDMVTYLVQQGADKDKANNDGWTALFRAAANAHLPVVRFLVEQGILFPLCLTYCFSLSTLEFKLILGQTRIYTHLTYFYLTPLFPFFFFLRCRQE